MNSHISCTSSQIASSYDDTKRFIQLIFGFAVPLGSAPHRVQSSHHSSMLLVCEEDKLENSRSNPTGKSTATVLCYGFCHILPINAYVAYTGRVELHQDHVTIFQNILRSDVSLMSIAYLKKLTLLCDKVFFDQQFLGEKLPRTGGPEFVLNNLDQQYFTDLYLERPQTTLKRERVVMFEDYYNAN